MRALILILTLFGIFSCGVIDRPDIPATEQEKIFYKELQTGNPIIDSIKREVVIGRMGCRILSTNIQVDVYAKNVDMTSIQMDSITKLIYDFYARPILPTIKNITECEISLYPKNSAIEIFSHKY